MNLTQNLKSRVVLGVLVVVLVAVHWAMASIMVLPLVYGDEACYIGNARLLAGTGVPINVVTGPARWGHSIFLTPAYVLFSDPYTAYRASLFIGGLMISLCLPMLYHMATRWFDAPPRVAALASLLTCLYPSFLVTSNTLYTMTSFAPAFLLSVIALGRLVETGRRSDAMAFVVFVALLFAIHSRAAVLIPLALLLFVALWRTGRLSTRIALQCLLAVVIVALFIEAIERVFDGAAKIYAEKTAKSLSRNLGRVLPLLSTEHFFPFLGTVAGHLWYLFACSYLVFAAGLVAALRLLFGAPDESAPQHVRVRRWVLVYIVASFVLILLTSATFLHGGGRGDTVYYGRHSESVIAPVLLLGFLALHPARVFRRSWGLLDTAAAVVLAAVFALIFFAQWRHFLESRPFTDVSATLGIYALQQLAGGFHAITTISLLALAGGLVVLLPKPRALQYAALAALGVVFLSSGAWTFYRYFVPPSRSLLGARAIDTWLRENHAAPDAIAYDLSAFSLRKYYDYQLALPRTIFRNFSSADGELPASRVVIAASESAFLRDLGGEVAMLENYYDQALWVLPGPLQDEWRARHWFFPPAYTARLPADALKCRLDLERPHRRGYLGIRVTNEGNSPWVNVYALPKPLGAVRIHVDCRNGGGSAVYRRDLPRCLHPGESVIVDIPPPWSAYLGPDSTSPVKPGDSYRCSVQLVQEGIQPFPDVLTIDVPGS
ncbi:hypothetical protein HS125_14470 [bacterium]|nr:hypothetical protein [bacterium]